ncbi:thioredoxin domain-containing protein [Sulfuriflexus mobilis]|uniref:thioredoxin domain-containing protein n=1 Tax=Sulfuriflexus mobilis TaxID=1811807 RepID=UPI000F84DA5E|nr:DUF255 domain-containing protein [Sulfuriflexus mobilis]
MYRRLMLGISLLLMVSIAHADLKNTLANNASPYLAMHGGDPVHWQEWNEQAVAAARKENKLLFVSIGYFACHWCHVMQRESYQDAAIATKLNRDFIPIKVDRELNPALDSRLIEFVERTRGYSGWPLNVFITPQGHPLLGIVYLPAKDFDALLTELNTLWQQNPQQLADDARLANEELQVPRGRQETTLQKGLAEKARKALRNETLSRADSFAGGFGNQSKFPSVPQLEAMLDVYADEQDSQVGDFLRLTLDNMSRLGLNDLIGGGFFRYTVDPQWRVPHFEKMLYDNALLARLYLRASKVLNETRYLKTARETLDFMLTSLRSPQGGMYASLSAIDDKQVEGGFYLWQVETLQQLLTAKEWLAVEKAWQISGGPTTEDGYLPIALREPAEVAAELGISEAGLEKSLQSARKKMFQQRSQRNLPVDNKRLAGWNGMALSAFAQAAQQTGDKTYQSAAREIRDYIVNTLWEHEQVIRARDGRGQPIGQATLEDYAYVAQGLVDWARYTDKAGDFSLAMQVIEQAWSRFYTRQGWRLTESSLLAMTSTEVMLADGPIPSASAVLVQASLDVLQHTDNADLRKRVMLAVAAGQEMLLAEPYWFASHAREAFRF